MTETAVSLVTGAASGIGAAVAQRRVSFGDYVAMLDIDQVQLESAAGRLGPRATPFAVDVTSESEVARTIEQVVARIGTPSRVVCAAGIDRGGLLHELDAATWNTVISTNLTGTFLVLKHAIRSLLAAEIPGSIVCVSSPAARVAFAAGGSAAYSASKAAVSAVVRAAAIDYASSGIRVNAVIPGPTETPLMWANVAPDSRTVMTEQIEREVPLGRLAEPDEAAAGIDWLLSDESSYVTGSHLTCDGGVLAKASISV